MKHTLMAVFAHPDDEAFGTGGTLARYAAEGHDVYLVTATRGEAGGIAEPTLATPSNLPFIREQELRCACDIYGIHPPIFLDYVDGQLPIVHQGQAVGKLVRLIRELGPEVLITFGPDGIYGHYDHIAVHRWTTIAADLAADPDCFPDLDQCHPHQVSKLYYRTLAQEEVDAMAVDHSPAAVVMDGVPFYFFGRPLGEVTTIIDVSDYTDVKLQGIRCHSTQVGQQYRFQDEIAQDTWFNREAYVLARPSPERVDRLETDLLEGLERVSPQELPGDREL